MSVESWLARASIEVPVAAARSRRTDLALAVGVLVALLAAMLPLLRVIDPGWWLAGSVLLSASVLATGFLARWFRLPGIAVAVLEAVVWLAGMTAMFAGTTSIVWFVPTPATFEMVPALVASAIEEIQVGAAPLDAGFALTFLIVGAVGVLAVAMDHVVLTARMSLLAAVGLVAVSLIPSLAVPGDIDVASLLLLAVSILFLMRTDTRERQRMRDVVAGGMARLSRSTASTRASAPIGGVSATAFGIGAIAVIVALVATPLLPAPLARTGGNGLPGSGAFIDPTLELGDDLRQPREIDVLEVSTTAANPPYLRAVTLTRFDGAVWEPDEGRTPPIPADGVLPEVVVDEDIPVSEYRTNVDVLELNSPWLPVPYPVTEVSGLEGQWALREDGRTIATSGSSTRGQRYEATATVARPTLEQARAHEAVGGDEESRALPQGMPPVIAETATAITAGAENDYDALRALQSWFRGPDFSYSLESPVDDGFDGSGADAVADFLDEREGYCVHFASAFALMARSLGMPARIVVGYLPGTSTGGETEGRTVYTVTSGQLHAWPEVLFDGIGWVSFEPTNSLGVPTAFSPGATGGDTGTNDPQEPTQPTATPGPTATSGPRPQDDVDAGGTAAGDTAGSAPPPAAGIALAVVLALIAPATIRLARRRRLLANAESGEPTAAWASVQELAIDLGIAVPAAESPRAFGARLVAEHGAAHEDVQVLVHAIERASYAEDPGRRHSMFGEGERYAGAVRAVSAALLGSAGFWRRCAATIAPRSLVVRAGSAYAVAGSRHETAGAHR